MNLSKSQATFESRAPLHLCSRKRLRLLCFPYAGGSASSFSKWYARLPEMVDVCPIELPGRGRRIADRAFTHVQALAQALIKDVLPYFDLPVVFFGHSMGALISFELARAMRKTGVQPVGLIVSGRRAPHSPLTAPRTFNLPDRDFTEELRRMKGTPDDVLEHAEFMEFMLPILRADFELCQTYTYLPEPPIHCPITLFMGEQDEEAKRQYIDAWKEQTLAEFRTYVIPGDHFFLRTEETLFLRMISAELKRLMAAMNSPAATSRL
jgi:medium-chain acyl-[acyl-carrier-protein] hydrolase